MPFCPAYKKGISPPIALIPERHHAITEDYAAIRPSRSDRCDDRNPVATNPERPKTKSKARKEAKPAKIVKPAKAPKPKAERANKKAEVISLMKRAKGAALAEIMKATGWHAHTVRGFIGILVKNEKTESFRAPTVGGHTESRGSRFAFLYHRRFRFQTGRFFCFV